MQEDGAPEIEISDDPDSFDRLGGCDNVPLTVTFCKVERLYSTTLSVEN